MKDIIYYNMYFLRFVRHKTLRPTSFIAHSAFMKSTSLLINYLHNTCNHDDIRN